MLRFAYIFKLLQVKNSDNDNIIQRLLQNEANNTLLVTKIVSSKHLTPMYTTITKNPDWKIYVYGDNESK